MDIRSLFLSLIISIMPITSAQACLTGHPDSIFLDEVISVVNPLPEQLDKATFEGNVELTRVTVLGEELSTEQTAIVRGVLIESKTHPKFIGRKITFFYDVKICHHLIFRAGDRGFVMGRALNLGSEVLYVAPYIYSSKGFKEMIITEDETIPITVNHWDRY